MNDSVNNTVSMGIDAIMQQPVPLWMKALALIGGISLLQFALSNMLSVVYFCAYLYGFIKWLLGRND